MQCEFILKSKKRCSRISKNKFCWQHTPTESIEIKENPQEVNPQEVNPQEVNPQEVNPQEVNPQEVNPQEVITIKNHKIHSSNLFKISDPQIWEESYNKVIELKYNKNSKNFSKLITGKPLDQSYIFMIPRHRGYPYKKFIFDRVNADDIQYALCGKGYPMQELSSISLGPVIGEGLCVFNSACSKSICIEHIEGGCFDINSKNFWKRSKKPLRIITYKNYQIFINGVSVNINNWLKINENLWLDEWTKWSQAIALCNNYNVKWPFDSIRVSFRFKGEYINFVSWKKECYIKPAFELIPQTNAYKYLKKIQEQKIPIGLVHSGPYDGNIIKPITKEYLLNLFNSETEMFYPSYVVAAKLLDVKI